MVKKTKTKAVTVYDPPLGSHGPHDTAQTREMWLIQGCYSLTDNPPVGPDLIDWNQSRRNYRGWLDECVATINRRNGVRERRAADRAAGNQGALDIKERHVVRLQEYVQRLIEAYDEDDAATADECGRGIQSVGFSISSYVRRSGALTSVRDHRKADYTDEEYAALVFADKVRCLKWVGRYHEGIERVRASLVQNFGTYDLRQRGRGHAVDEDEDEGVPIRSARRERLAREEKEAAQGTKPGAAKAKTTKK